MIDIKTEMKMVVDTREEGKVGGDYFEFEINDDIDITTQDDSNYCGTIVEIGTDCIVIDDDDRGCFITIMFRNIADVDYY